MLRNYLRTTLRSVGRHRAYTFVNVTGLAIGLACCLLILLYIADERSYDEFHEDADRIARLAIEMKGGDGQWRGRAVSFYGLADLVQDGASGIETTARLARSRALIATDDVHFMEENILFASASALDVFTIPFERGNPATAFDAPFSAVVTPDFARRLFGDIDPVGQTFTYNSDHTYQVTGVVQQMPANSHFSFDVLLNIESTREWYHPDMFVSMGAQWVYTYVRMDPSMTARTLENGINRLVQQYIPPETPVEARILVQPLTDIHLHSRLASEIEPTGDIRTLRVFGAIAVFILVIACLNFMNLATARASMRAREVGVRKLLGAHRGQLVRQFLLESITMAAVAGIVSLALAAAALPVFNSLADRSLAWSELLTADLLIPLAAISLLTGLVAGSYPAFFLSAFRPARVLKGVLSAGGRDASTALRKGLVVVQFGISIAIVIGTLIVGRQLGYMQNEWPGFDREQIVSVRIPGSVDDSAIPGLKDALLGIPGVERVAAASNAPADGLNSWPIRPAGATTDQRELVERFAVDPDFVRTLGLDIIAGRDFRTQSESDGGESIIINEATADYFGLENPVGQTFTFDEGLMPTTEATVIGVVRDFHHASFHDEIQPLFLYLRPNYNRFLVRLDTKRTSDVIGGIQSVWSARVADWPLEYAFLDDRFAALYDAERRLSRIFRVFSILAVVVACLGLFGLSAYIAERRTREIGVRRVFGAGVPGLIGLLTKDFLALVLAAFVIAAPTTWWAMQTWLEDFAYRAEFGAGLFIWTALGAVAVAVLTVGWQSGRAALRNPIDSLRTE